MKKFSYLCTTKKRKDMDKKKIFTSNAMPEIFYQVMEEGWLDDDTYVIVFQDMVDVDGDTFHMEVEYHKDEERITYTRVYDYENVDGKMFISPCFKKQIDEYILQQVGMLRKGSVFVTKEISVELVMDVPEHTSMGEFQDFLRDLKVEIIGSKFPRDEKIKILKVTNKGIK